MSTSQSYLANTKAIYVITELLFNFVGLSRHSFTAYSTVVSTMLPTNTTVSTVLQQITTMAIQPSFSSQIHTKTTTIFSKSSSHKQLILASSSKHLSATSESTSTLFLKSSSELDIASTSSLTFLTAESSSIQEMQTPITSLTPIQLSSSINHTSVSMTTTQTSQRKSSIDLQTEIMSSIQPLSITQMSTFQRNTTEVLLQSSTEVLSSSSAEMVVSMTTEWSMLQKSSNASVIMTSRSSVLLQQASPSKIDIASIKNVISSTQPNVTTPILSASMIYQSSTHLITTTEILSAMSLPSSFIIKNNSTSLKEASQTDTKSTASTVRSLSLDKTISSSYKSKKQSFYATKTSPMAKVTSPVTTSFVMTSSSYSKATIESSNFPTSSYKDTILLTPKLLASSQMKMSSSPQTKSSLAESSHFVPSPSIETKKISTNSRNVPSTKILQSSPTFTSTADELHLTMIGSVNSSSHNSASSYSRDQGK